MSNATRCTATPPYWVIKMKWDGAKTDWYCSQCNGPTVTQSKAARYESKDAANNAILKELRGDGIGIACIGNVGILRIRVVKIV